jgi:hypothetical protein
MMTEGKIDMFNVELMGTTRTSEAEEECHKI